MNKNNTTKTTNPSVPAPDRAPAYIFLKLSEGSEADDNIDGGSVDERISP